MLASYSYKVVDYHTDSLNFHTCLHAPHNFATCYNMVGFGRHKYRVAELAGSCYRSRMGWSHAPLPTQIDSHSLSMAGTKDLKR